MWHVGRDVNETMNHKTETKAETWTLKTNTWIFETKTKTWNLEIETYDLSSLIDKTK